MRPKNNSSMNIEIRDNHAWRMATDIEKKEIMDALDGLHPETDGLAGWFRGEETHFQRPVPCLTSPELANVAPPKPKIIVARLIKS